MSLLTLVRKKILGKGLYEACVNKDPRVNDQLLLSRLNHLHKKGMFNRLTLQDIQKICKLKKREVHSLAMDGPEEKKQLSGQEIKIMEEYYPSADSTPGEKSVIYDDERADIEHDEPYELVFFPGEDCLMFSVIEQLYNLLILRNICFLQGAFVFADQEGELFQKLLHRCNYNYRRAVARNITHDVFINNEIFDNRRKNSKLDTKFLKDNQLFYPNAANFKFYMYEIPIQTTSNEPFDFNYACDEKCRENDSNKIRCPDNIKQPKRILLMYPFQVNYFPEDGSRKIVKRYLYMKLEDSPAVSATHMVGSFQTYIMPKLFGQREEILKYPVRRERIVGSEAPYANTSIRETDNNFYNLVNADLQEVLFYNTRVRNHYEFFVPQNVTNMFIKDISNIKKSSEEELP